MTRAIEPTENELRAVWLTVRHRQGWPATFEDAMADATLSRLLRLNALHPPRSLRAGHVVPSPAPLPAPHAAARRPPARLRPAMAPAFDRKRAAAGDRDDD